MDSKYTNGSNGMKNGKALKLTIRPYEVVVTLVTHVCGVSVLPKVIPHCGLAINLRLATKLSKQADK